jgi:predicted ribosomally synthesized peptide with SipW-like signal peptide
MEKCNTLLTLKRPVCLFGESYVRKLPHGWQGLVWGILGFLMILSGIASGNIVTIIIGGVLGLAGTSAYLTSQVKSERIIKKVAEVASAIMAMAIIIARAEEMN